MCCLSITNTLVVLLSDKSTVSLFHLTHYWWDIFSQDSLPCNQTIPLELAQLTAPFKENLRNSSEILRFLSTLFCYSESIFNRIHLPNWHNTSSYTITLCMNTMSRELHLKKELSHYIEAVTLIGKCFPWDQTLHCIMFLFSFYFGLGALLNTL